MSSSDAIIAYSNQTLSSFLSPNPSQLVGNRDTLSDPLGRRYPSQTQPVVLSTATPVVSRLDTTGVAVGSTTGSQVSTIIVVP